jgi:hypothetical protein
MFIAYSKKTRFVQVMLLIENATPGMAKQRTLRFCLGILPLLVRMNKLATTKGTLVFYDLFLRAWIDFCA